MKTMITPSTFLAGLLLCAATNTFAQTPSNVGGTVAIGGLNYTVNTKTPLTTGVEYYVVKANPKATAKSYLRTNETYNPTVFTQAKYEAFLKTGKLSSFGTLSTQVANGGTMYYTTVGSTTAAFSVSGGKLTIYEFEGTVARATTFNPDLYCNSQPAAKRNACLKAACSAYCSGTTDKAGCEKQNCSTYKTTNPYEGIHILPSTKTILMQ